MILPSINLDTFTQSNDAISRLSNLIQHASKIIKCTERVYITTTTPTKRETELNRLYEALDKTGKTVTDCRGFIINMSFPLAQKKGTTRSEEFYEQVIAWLNNGVSYVVIDKNMLDALSNYLDKVHFHRVLVALSEEEMDRLVLHTLEFIKIYINLNEKTVLLHLKEPH